METEIWKPIPGYDGNYLVSNKGNVQRIARVVKRSDGQIQGIGAKVMAKHLDKLGYERVDIQYQGPKRGLLVHRLVALTFLPPATSPDKREINHKDGNKRNNTPDNLEWCTRTENMQHAISLGLKPPAPKGVDHKRSKPVAMFDPISGKHLHNFVNISEAGKFVGRPVHASKISACCKGKRQTAYGYKWKYLKSETVSTNSVECDHSTESPEINTGCSASLPHRDEEIVR